MSFNFSAAKRAGCWAVAGILFAFSVAAQSQDPRDFEGFWRVEGWRPSFTPGGVPTFDKGTFGEQLPYNEAGQRIAAKLMESRQQGKPQIADAHLTCRPNGIATLGPQHAALVAQTPDKLIFISQEDRDVRKVFMNQKHPKKLEPTYMGHSVGHWEGNTLVIDTVGYNGRGSTITNPDSMPGGISPPTSDRLHTIERWTKSEDGNTLNIVLTVDDPGYYKESFTEKYTWHKLPWRVRLLDYDCAENPREDDFAAWTFEGDWFKPTCVRPVKGGLASDTVICRPQPKP